MVELAILLPVFAVLFAFAAHLTELLEIRLRLQELARFAAWEMTSHTLTDYGSKSHDRNAAHRGAFEEAARQVSADVATRYADLDSAANEAPRRFLTLDADLPVLRVREQEVGWGGSGPESAVLDPRAGAFMSTAGFNAAGQVRVDAELRVGAGNVLGVSLGAYSLQSRYTLIANGWHLPDGGDATVLPGRRRAGLHRNGEDHGLYRQTARMTFVGAGSLETQVPGLQSMQGFFHRLGFSPMGTYVVSHAYAETERGEDFKEDRGCNRLRRHPAKRGLHNLASAPGIDHPYLSCFDTTPLRDTHDYDASLGLQQLARRGRYFMGCQFAQADDPTAAAVHDSDAHQHKQVCYEP